MDNMINKTEHGNGDRGRMMALEANLAQALRPVRPRQDFVRRVREGIRLPERAEIALKLQDWENLLIVFGSVLSGAVVILTLARALFHLFGRRHMP